MNWCTKNIPIILAAAVLVYAALQPEQAGASCIDCHNDIWLDAQNKLYIHAPVATKNCASCHTGAMDDEQNLNTQQELPPTSVIAKVEQKQRVHWLAETFTPAKQHFALLQPQYANSNLTIEAWSQQRDKVQFDYSLPALSAMAPAQFIQPLSIEPLYLLDENDLLLAHANVVWQTNNPSRCTVTYRANGNEYAIEEDDLYTLQHRVTLHNFNKNDMIRVCCSDPTGNHSSSLQQRVHALPLFPDTGIKGTSAILTKEQLLFSFSTVQKMVWLQMSAPVKFSVSIGTTQQQTGEDVSSEKTTVDLEAAVPIIPGTTATTRQSAAANDEHTALLSPRAINLTICYRCHQEMLGWTSHPVDVTPQPGMIIPPEYPLLPDGRISCMTCHSVHSSNREYRLIKSSKRELCTGCHVNY